MDTHLDPHLLSLLAHFRLDRTYVRGDGARLVDDRGREVLDFTSQYGALPFGHHDARIWDALLAAREVPALVQPSRPLIAERLAARLARVAPVRGDAVVVFRQSGSEAVEVAVEACRAATGRALVIAAERAYHGKTVGASALTWSTRGAGVVHVRFDDVAALERAISSDVAAVILEPVQGEGGVHAARPEYLRAARALCDRHGAKLVLDEVQTGLGRCGALFAAELSGVKADAVCISKALGGGLVPIAATVIARDAWTEEYALSHGSTFAQNNFTCAIGLAVLDALDACALARVRVAGERLRAGLDAISARHRGAIRAVRSVGLLCAVELEPPGCESSFFLAHMGRTEAWHAIAASWLLNGRGLRVIPCLTDARALRVQPPLDVSNEEIDEALAAFDDLAATIARRDWARLLAPLVSDEVPAPRDARALDRPVIASHVAPGDDPTRFAFLLHPTCVEDHLRTTPALRSLDRDVLERLYRWTTRSASHAPVSFLPAVRGRGSVAQGWLISLSGTPESWKERPREQVSREIQDAVRTARDLGAHVVGLGAFTSILTRNGADVGGEGALTTGTALTVALAVDGVRVALERLGRDPSSSLALVVGLGAVGSAAAVVASDFLPRILLAGNPSRPEREAARALALADQILERAARRLGSDAGVARSLARLLALLPRLGPRGFALRDRILRAPEKLAGEVAWACRALGVDEPVALADLSAVAGSDVVITATSAAAPLIGPADLAPGAIVCDVAKPADVSRSVRELRPDVLVFDGGLARWPEPLAFGQNLGHAPGVNLACLTETVVLALEGKRTGRFGVGLARDLVDEVAAIRLAAAKHGFSVAELRLDGEVLGSDAFARVASARRVRARIPA